MRNGPHGNTLAALDDLHSPPTPEAPQAEHFTLQHRRVRTSYWPDRDQQSAGHQTAVRAEP